MAVATNGRAAVESDLASDTKPMSDNERSRERGPFAGCLAAALLFGLPAYVLSVGPFVWLVNHRYAPEWLGIIYWPIGLVIVNCEPAEQALRWYLAFWQSP